MVYNRDIIYNLIKTLIFLLSFATMMLGGVSNKLLAEYHFYFLLILALVEFLQTKKLTLYIIWIVGFIYIMLSEMIVNNYGPRFNTTTRFLLLANNLLLIGYSIANEITYKQEDRNYYNGKNKLFAFVIFLLYIYYIYTAIPKAEVNYLAGRQLVSTLGSGSLSGLFNRTLSLCLPSIIAFYVVGLKKKSKWLAFLIVVPILIFIYMGGTRFKLLFSAAPFFLISGFFDFNKMNFKNLVILLLLGIVFVSLTNTLKFNRNESLADLELFSVANESNRVINEKKRSFADWVANHCSPEGTVEMSRLGEMYFEYHPHTYGKSIGFITYFWVPRRLWPNKPTQIDHWLPRYYNPKMSDKASTSSGFMGELRADFGIYSLFFIFLFGCVLKKLNSLLNCYDFGRKPRYESLFVVMFIPMTFFCVRGLNLAITTCLCQILLLLILKKLFFVRDGK